MREYNLTYDYPQNISTKNNLKKLYKEKENGYYVPNDVQPLILSLPITRQKPPLENPINRLHGGSRDSNIVGEENYEGQDVDRGIVPSTFSLYPVHMGPDKPEIIPNRTWNNYSSKMYNGYDVYDNQKRIGGRFSHGPYMRTNNDTNEMTGGVVFSDPNMYKKYNSTGFLKGMRYVDPNYDGRLIGGARPRDFVLPQYDKYLYARQTPYSVQGAGMSGGNAWDDIWSGVKDTASFINQNAKDTWNDPQTRKDLIDLGIGALTRGGGLSGGSKTKTYEDHILRNKMCDELYGCGFFDDVWHGIKQGASALGHVGKEVLSDPEVKHFILNGLKDIAISRVKGSGASGGGASGGGFFDDVWSGIKQGASTIGNVAKDVLSDPEVKHELLSGLKDVAISRAKGGGSSGGRRGRPKKGGGASGGALTDEEIRNNRANVVGTMKLNTLYKKDPFEKRAEIHYKQFPIHSTQTQELGYDKLYKDKDFRKSKQQNPRGLLIKKLMKEHKLSLGQASAYIKKYKLM